MMKLLNLLKYKKTDSLVIGFTHVYCAPEQCTNTVIAATPKFDMWSFGIILYELMTNSLAWERQRVPKYGDDIPELRAIYDRRESLFYGDSHRRLTDK